MKKKGFTLIELLGVIIILALLMIIVFPSVINNIKSSDDSIEDDVKTLINNAVDLHIRNNPDIYIKSNKNTYCIPIDKLISDDYLDSDIVESSKNITLDWKVMVNDYNKETNKFIYTISNSCTESYVCSIESDADNSGTINLGDIVNCGDEKFYVMDNDGNKITMLTKYRVDIIAGEVKQSETAKSVNNFSETPYWLDSQENVLSKYTPHGDSQYSYVFDKNVNDAKNSGTVIYHVVEYDKYLKKIGVVTSDTKLMSYEQAKALRCTDTYGTNDGTCKDALNWVYSETYWLGSYSYVKVSGETSIRIWSIDSDKSFDRPGYQTTNYYHGVRPVVTISIHEVKSK